ncbi:hypothetical protein [Deinococcus arenicola]|uniref:Uncharacterized protein n=1 Tax=Deinococcus arenicola TaxID=2994950 RepID=A0ABU4DTN2_9DEIO|nr:hypothetical protein [Deinococcus sp. ZS9-10]MDV6375803.1 hypothetical protein [Deinococcus sp. ZS9-10]
MNVSFLPRTALITGLVIGALNIVFGGIEYGFDRLPIWFYLVQLLLIPAMVVPMFYFPQASVHPDFLHRAAYFAMGWAVPFAIYKFSLDVLNPAFSPAASLISYLLVIAVFSVVMAAIRKPNK